MLSVFALSGKLPKYSFKIRNGLAVDPTAETVFPLALFQKALTRGTRLRIKNARWRNADNNQRGSAELTVIDGANNIGFGVNGIPWPVGTDTILSNGDEMSALK